MASRNQFIFVSIEKTAKCNHRLVQFVFVNAILQNAESYFSAHMVWCFVDSIRTKLKPMQHLGYNARGPQRTKISFVSNSIHAGILFVWLRHWDFCVYLRTIYCRWMINAVLTALKRIILKQIQQFGSEGISNIFISKPGQTTVCVALCLYHKRFCYYWWMSCCVYSRNTFNRYIVSWIRYLIKSTLRLI